MSDWKKRNEDWRDEDELEEEEECECPWVDSKGKVRETAYCQYLFCEFYRRQGCGISLHNAA